MKLNKIIKRSRIGTFGCAGLFGLLAATMLCPMSADSANADTQTSSRVQANVQSMISIGLQQAVEIDVTPKSGGVFGKNTATMTVTTNSANGYSVSMSTTGDGTLKNVDASNTAKINPVAAGASESSFGENTWGYALAKKGEAASTYNPVSTTGQEVLNVSKSDITPDANGYINPVSYDLTFGTQVGTNLPAGSYTNNVLISAVANPVTVTNLLQLTYMQDMTSDICKNTELHTEKQLIDTRDGNAYFVAKLRDGNCWMVQNLALNLTSNGLSASDSDLEKDWNPANCNMKITLTDQADGTQTNAITTGSQYADNNGGTTGNYMCPQATETSVPKKVASPLQIDTRSWNLGKYILIDPEDGTLCTASGGSDQYDSVLTGGSLSSCAHVGFLDVSGPEWKPTFKAQQGTWNYAANENKWETTIGDSANSVLIAANTETKEYDPHYLIGNYYQFNTATAGRGGSQANTNVEGSICPKGWKLPLSGNNTSIPALDNNNKNGSFYNMLAGYGLTSKVSSEAVTGVSVVQPAGQANATYNVGAGEFNIAGAPLHFVRSGWESPNRGSMRKVGYNGYLRSSITTTYSNITTATTYEAGVYNTSLNPSNGLADRLAGIPIRCLNV